MTDHPKRPLTASEMGRLRWSRTGHDPQEIGKLGGRPPLPRCKVCGMTETIHNREIKAGRWRNHRFIEGRTK